MEIKDDSADTGVYKGPRSGVDTSSLDNYSRILPLNNPDNFRSYRNRSDNNGAVKPSDKLHNIDLDRIHFDICYHARDADKINEFFDKDINYYLGLFLISNTGDNKSTINTDNKQLNFFLSWLSKNMYESKDKTVSSIDTSELTDDLAGYVMSISKNFKDFSYIENDGDDPNILDIQMYISKLSMLLDGLDYLDSSVRLFEQTSTNFALGSVYDSLKSYMKKNTDKIIDVGSLIDIIDRKTQNNLAPVVFAELLTFLETIDATGKHKDKIKKTLENFSDSYKEGRTFGNPDGQTHILQYIYSSLGGKKELFPVKDTPTGKYLRLKAGS